MRKRYTLVVGSKDANLTAMPAPRRALIVRPSALGDVCRTVPALVAMSKAWPDARIDWLVQAGFEASVASHPHLHQVICFDRKRMGKPAGWGDLARLVTQLRRARYDVVVDLQGLARSAFFTRMTGSSNRVGFANAREGAAWAYNRKHSVDADLHAVDRMMGLLAAEGLDASQPNLQLYTAEADRAWLAHEHPALQDEPYACLAPTARWLCKCWPIESYIAIAHRLLDSGIAGQRLVILASPREQAVIQPLLDAFKNDDRLIWPSTTVGQLMALIARTSMMVCNDSAPLHMAVGFDRPIATIFGPTDPRLVGPFQRDETVLRPPGIGDELLKTYRHNPHDQTLIATVSQDAVWRVIEQQATSSRCDRHDMRA